ncbi:hypothetical protein HETIRDRAFT_426357 [Heterobasidion irregulare TC 32-1]|uniref:Uncharacterized protein n=1 Tax=Heterobasidion irregulare (strain TC 32-1) TaxID=747525 RepID=W4KAW1_HETIT|nr:uncharacterized protein HETIRDRAFT_426357 [Heterobasidion irregulare TC 32-1]ETW82859.1 hypothetical protein HETIRDRAFT_426357 [Heterobasidion irregulare TC 32-1]
MSATGLDVRHVITGPVIEVSVQSVVYGAHLAHTPSIYVALIIITTYTIMRKGLQSKVNIVMLFISLFMFTMSSGVLALSLASFIETFSGPGQLSEGRFHALSGSAAAMFVVNLILSDSVMVWRASLLWAGSKIVIVIILGFLGATTVSAIMFIGCTGKIFKNNTLCNYASYGGLVLSFTTNFTSMLLIAITAWSVIQQAFE